MNQEEINSRLAEINVEILTLKELGNKATPEQKATLNELQMEVKALIEQRDKLLAKDKVTTSTEAISGEAPTDYLDFFRRKAKDNTRSYSRSFAQLDAEKSGYARITVSSKGVGEVEEARIKIALCDIHGVEHVQNNMKLTAKQIGFKLPAEPEYGDGKNLYKIDIIKGGFDENPNIPGQWYHKIYEITFQTVKAEIVRIETLPLFGEDFSLETKNRVKRQVTRNEEPVYSTRANIYNQR